MKTFRPGRRIASSILAVGVLAASGVALLPEAQAADAPTRSTWSVEPVTKDGKPTNNTSFAYNMAPGSSLIDYVGISNYGDKPLTLEVYAADGFTTDEGGTDVLPAAAKSTDVGAWITLPKRKVTVQPKSRTDLAFRVNVPAKATPGDHAGAIVAGLAATTNAGANRSVVVDRRVGTRVDIRVKGAIKPQVEIQNLTSSYSASANPLGGRLTLTYDVVNTGNATVTADQKATIKALGFIPVNSATLPQLPTILPGSTVKRTQVIDGVTAGGTLTTTIELSGAAAGISTPVTFTASAKTTTIAIPWALLALLVIAVLVTLYIVRRRKVKVSANGGQDTLIEVDELNEPA